MKLLVLSDSHHNISHMITAVEQQSPDRILHLGDHFHDAEALLAFFPAVPLTAVPGNCDSWTGQPPEQLLELEGRRILLSHGHLWHVKSGFETALQAARAAQADIVLFGHTHNAYCRQESDGLWVMNPGSAGNGTYGIIRLENSQIVCYTDRVN